MATLTVKERQHLAREEAIVETAYDMLAEQGYERMSMDDLAKQVGIAKATLYQHFPSKEDVLVGVIVNFMRLGEAALLNEADAELPPIQRLERGLRRCMLGRIRLSHGNVAVHPVNLKSHPRYLQQHDHLFQRINEVVEQSKAAGEINPVLATPVIVHTIMWLFRIDFQAMMHIQGCTPEQAVDTLVTIVINGLKRPKPIHIKKDEIN
ncbi:MAG: TetR/AcrR family transcriptional regulator [Aggregatilineales bacterium]